MIGLVGRETILLYKDSVPVLRQCQEAAVKVEALLITSSRN